MSNKRNYLVGKWETWDEDSRVVYEITGSGKGLKIRAFDKHDGEEYVVSLVKWDGKSLSFEIYVPSTKYRTKNRLKPVSKTKLIQEITFCEPWKKVATFTEPQRRKSAVPHKR